MKFSKNKIKQMLLEESSLKKLNSFYNGLDSHEKEVFHTSYAKIFREEMKIDSLNTTWTVQFADHSIKVPLRAESMWLDWDTAVSIVGHDIEVKAFYKKLILSEYKPKLVFDVGANYGTHSILFLATGIDTITFEPNPACYDSFDTMAKLNNLKYNLEKVAVGETESTATLVFPEKDTWLGSLTEEYVESINTFDKVKKVETKVITLDNYTDSKGIVPDFIKIDTEGFEINVIKGAKKLLRNNPTIITFECIKQEEKQQLFEQFDAINYQIHELQHLTTSPLSKTDFMQSEYVNFLAISSEHPALKSDLFVS
ncbi:FkbM family methyltransferase [Bernardetia sp.]|uniref:FkbM family methyltransferase n=1 Tax=Bernardetia sp. TaxID=1937974 RepID=UPI0025C44C79|nr:FkbM family methyltransferase [Bernardetia sp.]